MSLIQFSDVDKISNRFIALLSELDINPPVDTAFENELLSPSQLLHIYENYSNSIYQDDYDLLRTAAGVHDLAAKVLSVENIVEFDNFVPHLRLIAESKTRSSSLSQNTKSDYDDDTARKMIELYIGCLVAHFGSNVELDHPSNSVGDNPDVLFTTENSLNEFRPIKWAIAIKTISSNQGQTIYERIKEAGKQIDSPMCKADRGIIILNVKNALNHEAFWSETFSSVHEAAEALGKQLEKLIQNVESSRDQKELDSIFSKKTARPILFLAQTLVKIESLPGPILPTELKLLYPYEAKGESNQEAMGIAHIMNHYMQSVLFGNPGSENSQPS